MRIVVVFFFFSITFLHAQKDGSSGFKKIADSDQRKAETANFFFDDQNYLRALPLYEDLMFAYSDIVYFKLRTAICYLYSGEKKEESVTLLESIEKEYPATRDIYFYLGRAYHLNNRFDEAILMFDKYLSQKIPINQQILAKRYIDYCRNAKEITDLKVNWTPENIGNVINTENQEGVPVISSDESVLIFTYVGPQSTGGLMNQFFEPDPNGQYYEDVFISNRLGSEWLRPESIGSNINTKNHDASIALSADGQKLFIYHSTEKDGGDIYVSNLESEVWGVPKSLGPNINTKYWEGSCSISADEQRLYFASERPGGMGGKDIYVSEKMADGSWGKAINLGPVINTPYNDDSPFIHPDGITLYFSSEGHINMGGYDIMYSTLKDNQWSKPVNIGYPVNTPDDERYYVLTASGEHGYFSSDRKGGYGQQDIYIVDPGFFGDKPPILALVVGTTTADDKPVSADINVTNTETGELQGSYRSNAASGKYLIALTPGNNYKIAIEMEGYQTQIQYVNVKNLDTYVQVQQDFKGYSETYLKENNIVVEDSALSIQDQISQQMKKYNEEKDVNVYEARVYQEILKNYGDVKKECVTYSIELGKYQNPDDFNADKIKNLGTINKRVDDKGNTIFSFDGYTTLLDAEIFKYKIIGKDTSFKKAVVNVNDCGQLKMVQQYFYKQYKRKGYVFPTETKSTAVQNNIVPLNNKEQLSNLTKDNGQTVVAGISYKVELGTVENEKDFKSEKWSKYGKVESKKYPDGKIRYSMGPFKTLAEAEIFKKMLTEKEPEAAQSLVTVFSFGNRKTIEEYQNPCNPSISYDFSFLADKNLGYQERYDKIINQAGGVCVEGLVFRVQIGAYRKPQNFKHENLDSLEPPPTLVTPYPDGITRFTMRDFKTLKEAEEFRKECIRLGTGDAWITALYQGKRILLQELIENNFFNKKIN